MVLDHLAAIFLFSGPLFYIGLLMAVDPAGIPTLYQWLLRVFRHFVQRLGGVPSEEIVEPEYTDISRRMRRVLRSAGVALLVFAIVI
jgi:hypothetical protein